MGVPNAHPPFAVRLTDPADVIPWTDAGWCVLCSKGVRQESTADDWACFDKTDREIEVYVSCF
jgi:hypothetical protein